MELVESEIDKDVLVEAGSAYVAQAHTASEIRICRVHERKKYALAFYKTIWVCIH